MKGLGHKTWWSYKVGSLAWKTSLSLVLFFHFVSWGQRTTGISLWNLHPVGGGQWCSLCLACLRPGFESHALTKTERNQIHDSKSIEFQTFFTVVGRIMSLKRHLNLDSLYLALVFFLLNCLRYAYEEFGGGKGQYRSTSQQPSSEILIQTKTRRQERQWGRQVNYTAVLMLGLCRAATFPEMFLP